MDRCLQVACSGARELESSRPGSACRLVQGVRCLLHRAGCLRSKQCQAYAYVQERASGVLRLGHVSTGTLPNCG